MVSIITLREREIINKKLNNISLTQNEANILSKTIRPKLRGIERIDARRLLGRLEYNQNGGVIEKKVREIVLKNVSEARVEVIVICGSAIQTNYKEYNDIDVIVCVNKVLDERDKRKLVKRIKEVGKGLDLDVQIYAKDSILREYSSNPSLIYQLKDSKVIYGRLNIPKKIDLSSLDLRMKLDWSDVQDNSSKEIYYALRNAMLVLFLMNKKVDNLELSRSVVNVLGEDLVVKLRSDKASKLERKLARGILKNMVNYLEKELRGEKWGKIEIENP